MAIYTFECPECGHRLEKIIRKPEIVYCPECARIYQYEEEVEMKQVLSVPSPAVWNCSKGSL